MADRSDISGELTFESGLVKMVLKETLTHMLAAGLFSEDEVRKICVGSLNGVLSVVQANAGRADSDSLSKIILISLMNRHDKCNVAP